MVYQGSPFSQAGSSFDHWEMKKNNVAPAVSIAMK